MSNRQWDKLSVVVASASLVVSIGALYAAYDGTRTTNRIAKEALETSRQSNRIAMGLAREPAVLEFATLASDAPEFNFTNPAAIEKELETTLTVKNAGERPIDGVAIEFIGMNGLTLNYSAPAQEFRSLPSYLTRLDFYAAIQPQASARIDIRRYILLYLTKLVPQLPNHNSRYRTVINVVLSPKATNDSAASPAGLRVTDKDQILIAIVFTPDILKSDKAKALLQSTEVAHRVYGN